MDKDTRNLLRGRKPKGTWPSWEGPLVPGKTQAYQEWPLAFCHILPARDTTESNAADCHIQDTDLVSLDAVDGTLAP